MANHGFVSSKKNLSKEQVLADLQEINQRRFQGLLNIEDSEWGENGSWFISYLSPGEMYPNGFNIWITSPRKLEHRHTHGWAYYLEIAFSSELGAKYGGKISDECCEEKWDPDPEKYPTFKAWIERRYGHMKDKHPDSYNELVSMEIETCPVPFRNM